MANRPTPRTDVNRSAILAHLGANGPASRAELARALAVSPALMTQLTQGPARRRPHRRARAGTLERRPPGADARARDIRRPRRRRQGRRRPRRLRRGRHRRPRAALGERAVRRRIEHVPHRARRPHPALHRRRQGATLLGVGVGVPGSVDLPGQRRRRRAAARLEQGRARRRPAPRARTTRDRREQRQRARRGGAALRPGRGRTTISSSSRSAPASAPASWSRQRASRRRPAARARSGTSRSPTTARAAAAATTDASRHTSARRPSSRGPRGRGRRAPRRAASRAPRGRRVRATNGPTRDLRRGREPPRPHPRRRRAHHRPGSSSVLGEGTAAWRHWSYGFEPAFRSHLLRHRRGIPVEVETWQDESWAQGAAALVLATPFDARRRGRPGPAHPRAARRAGGSVMSALRRRGRASRSSARATRHAPPYRLLCRGDARVPPSCATRSRCSRSSCRAPSR